MPGCRAVCLGFVVLFACAEGAVEQPLVPPPSCPVEPFASAAELTYDNLYQYVLANQGARKIKNGVNLIACMPDELFSLYTLMFDSGSPQEASVDRPRVLVFNRDTDLMLAFTTLGLPGAFEHAHGTPIPPMNFEVVQYQKHAAGARPAHRFDYYKIEYDEAGVHAVAPDKPNPVECMRCHQGSNQRQELALADDPRPNWEGYHQWDGAYGSADDFLSLSYSRRDYYETPLAFSDEKIMLKLLRRDGVAFEPDERVGERLDLIDLALDANKPWPLTRLDFERYEIAPWPVARTAFTHNIRITQYLANLNFRRIARILHSRPNWDESKQLTLSMLLGCYEEPSPGAILAHLDRTYGFVPDWAMSFRQEPDLTTPSRWTANFVASLAVEDPSLEIPIRLGDEHYNYGVLHDLSSAQIAAICGVK